MNALDYAVLVPGHGELQTDTAYIRHLQKLIESVRTQAVTAVSKLGFKLPTT